MKLQKVGMILDKLITLTIEEEEMHPSTQAKVWGRIGQVCIAIIRSSSFEGFLFRISSSFDNSSFGFLL